MREKILWRFREFDGYRMSQTIIERDEKYCKAKEMFFK